LPATVVRKHPVAFFLEQAKQDVTAARINCWFPASRFSASPKKSIAGSRCMAMRLEGQLAAAGSSDVTGEIPTRLIANYLISALIAMLADWVAEAMPRSPEEMDAIYQGLAEPTLRRLAGV
jgi:hypothetical protein